MRMLPAHVPGIFSVTVSILMGFRPSTLIRCVSTFDQNAQRISVMEGLSASKCIVTIRLHTFACEKECEHLPQTV